MQITEAMNNEKTKNKQKNFKKKVTKANAMNEKNRQQK